jgi:hypothetical protein
MGINRFTVNNVTYTAKPFDFGLICDLESVGVEFSNVDKMNMSFIRGYFALCADISKEEAQSRIQQHLVNGGSLEDITEVMAKEMSDSDFFRALSKKNEPRTAENPSESEADEPKKRGRKPTSNPDKNE